jgi:hypothetical protein
MMLRGLIIGIAVWLPATVFTSASWGQNQPLQNRRGLDAQEKGEAASILHKFSDINTQQGSSNSARDFSGDYYPQEITKSVERFHSEAERLAIKDILAELDKKSNREILGLKLAPDVCQEIACLGISPDTVRRYVAAYADMRVADDAHQTALRNAAAAERGTLIAAAAANVSLLSLLISGLSFWRTLRSTKSALPA